MEQNRIKVSNQHTDPLEQKLNFRWFVEVFGDFTAQVH